MPVINTNISAIYANNNVKRNSSNLQKDLQKLSSGTKINYAVDDASGLSISEKMRGQIRGLNQGSGNIEDAKALVDTADSSLQIVNNMLNRARELTIKGANGTNAPEDIAAIESELKAIIAQVDDIANRTEAFGKYPLLGGLSLPGKTIETSTEREISRTSTETRLPITIVGDNKIYSEFWAENEKRPNPPSLSDPVEISKTAVAGSTTTTSAVDPDGNLITTTVSTITETVVEEIIEEYSIAGKVINSGYTDEKPFEGLVDGATMVGGNYFMNDKSGRLNFTAQTTNGKLALSCYTGSCDNASIRLTTSSGSVELRSNFVCEISSEDYLQGGYYSKEYGEYKSHPDWYPEYKDYNNEYIGDKSTCTKDIYNGIFTHSYRFQNSKLGIDVTIVKKAVASPNRNYYTITFEVINNASEPVTVDLGYSIDTSYEKTDGDKKCYDSYYYHEGKEYTKTTLYTSGDIPVSVTSKKSNEGIDYGICLDLASDQDTPPDYLAIKSWNNGSSFADSIFELTEEQWKLKHFDKDISHGTNDGTNYGSDLTFEQVWLNRIVEGNSTSSAFTTKYGIADEKKDGNVTAVKGQKITDYQTPIQRTTVRVVEKTEVTTVEPGDGKLWIQTGANETEGFFINFHDTTAKGLGLDGFESLSPYEKAMAFLKILDEKAIPYTISYRSDFGATKNRLEATDAYNANASENLTSAESLIRDTDMAKTMMEQIKDSILTETAQSMLAQANQKNENFIKQLTSG